MVKVLVLSTPVRPPLYVESSARRLLLGRAASADVRLPDPSVSTEHALLQKRGPNYMITDAGSLNGTGVMAKGAAVPVWLTPDSPRIISDGDRLLLGRVELEVRTDSGAEGSPSEDLARDLVTVGLSTVDVEITGELIESALSELTELPDEPLDTEAEDEDPTESPDQAKVVVEEDRPRTLADLSLMLLALFVASVSLLGLYWLLILRG